MDWCIVGGGPSLIGFDFTRLDKYNVIAINRAYEVLPRAQYTYFSDYRFWGWHQDGLLAHPSIKVTGSPINVNHPDVVQYKLTGYRGIDLRPGKLRSGNNSGYAAINLAVHLNARRIYLFGFDMRAPEGVTHWHGGYLIKTKTTVYEANMLRYFPTSLKALACLGVEVYNVGIESKIECFKKIPLTDFRGVP